MSIISDIAQSILSIGEADSNSSALKKLNDLLKGTKLHSLTQNLRNYLKTERGKIRRDYSVRFQQYLLLVEIYLDVADHIGAKWRESANKETTKYRVNTSSKLFYKSIQICLDLLTLMENGSLTSCLSLWRMIYENYVVSLFLLSQSEAISRRFNDHETVELLATIDNMQERAKYDEKMQKLVAEYGNHFLETYGWAYEEGQTEIKTFSMLRRIAREDEFYRYYKLTSSLLHPSSLSVNRSFFSDGTRGNINMIGVFERNLHLPYRLVVLLMKSYANEMVDYFYKEDYSEKHVVNAVTNLVSDVVLGSKWDYGT